MKTPFETLLRLRAEAPSRARCPYTDQQLALLVSRVVAQPPRAPLALQPPVRPFRPRFVVRAASLALILFVTAYTVTPAQSGTPTGTTGNSSIAEAYSTTSQMVLNPSNPPIL